jgi:hypothetical protein
VVGIWSLVGQHKLRTAMSGDHLLLRELGNFDLLPPLSTVDSHFGGRNLASRRATQASHPGFHILQDNLSTIRGHVKRAPAALFRNISTSVGHLTRKVLTKLCVEFWVPELGTWNSVQLTPILVVGTWLLVGQHKLRTPDSTFCKTTCAPSKSIN